MNFVDETQEVVLGYEEPQPDGVVAQADIIPEEKPEAEPQPSSENGSDIQISAETGIFAVSPATPSLFNLISGLSPFEPVFQSTSSPSGNSIRIEDLLCGSSTGPTSALESEPTSLGSGTIPPLYIDTSDSTLITRKYASLLNYFKVAIGWTWVDTTCSNARRINKLIISSST